MNQKEQKIFTVPNVLTMLRFFMIAPIVSSLLGEQRLTAVIWMLVSTVTDLLDGFLARKLNQKSDLGRMMDPLADKFSVLAVAVVMVVSDAYHLPAWFLLFVLMRELLVLAAGLAVIRGRNIVMEASRPGKNSAFATALAVLAHVFDLRPWGLILVWAAVVLTVYSTWIYYRRFREQVQKEREGDAG